MMWPLILDATGAAPSLLQHIGVEFGLEGAESEEIFRLLLEETEVLEQPSEEISGEVLWWKEHTQTSDPSDPSNRPLANSNNSNCKSSSLKLGTQTYGTHKVLQEAKVPPTTYSAFGLSHSNTGLWAASSVTNKELTW